MLLENVASLILALSTWDRRSLPAPEVQRFQKPLIDHVSETMLLAIVGAHGKVLRMVFLGFQPKVDVASSLITMTISRGI